MNATQRKFALQEVESILRKKLKEIRESPNPNPQLSDKEIIDGLRSGKLKLKIPKRGYPKPGVTGLNFIIGNTVNERASYKWVENTKEGKALIAKAEELKRQIMLGDNDQVLEALKEFEKFKV